MERNRAEKTSRKSDRKKTEQASRESEECYRTMIEHPNDGVAIIRDEVYVFVNRKFLEMFGYQTPEELLGRKVTDAAVHLPHEDRERLSDMDRRTQKGEPAPSRYEFKVICKDGTALYAEASIAGIVYQTKPSLLVCLRDITGRKQAELCLRDSEEAMKSLLNATTDLALLMDTKGFIIAANDVVAERLGREADGLIGRNIFDLLPEGVTRSRQLRAEKVIESGKPVRFEAASADGRYFDSCMYPVLDDAGKVVRLAVYAKDITDIKHTSRRLVESESTFRRLLDSVNDGIVVRDAKTFELLDANRRFCQMWGYTFAEMKALPLGSLGAHTSVNERRERLIASYAQVANGAPGLVQFPARRKDGSTFWCELNVTRITIGTQDCLLSVARDITERREAEEAVKRSEEEALRLARETGAVAEIGRIISSSPDIEEVYERFAEEMRKLIPFDRIVVNLVNQLEGTLTTAYSAGMEVLGREKGFIFPITGTVTAEMMRTGAPAPLQLESIEEMQNLFPGLVHSFQAGLRSRLSVLLIARGEVIGSMAVSSKQQKAYGERDIRLAQSVAGQIAGAIANAELFRERKQTDEKIRASLKEKEVLLKEIHHRVKNNLQIISSLLFLQATKTEHPGAVSALRESRARIKSMALIHERLYQSSNLASVDMGEYTRNLVSDLRHSHRVENGLDRLTLNLENIPLGITEAIPCGLIINELVSNALRHAFPKGKEGEVRIQLLRGSTNQIMLTVSDNGIGFPEHVDFRKSLSLGLTLINSLVEQLDGNIELDQSGGTTFTITFG